MEVACRDTIDQNYRLSELDRTGHLLRGELHHSHQTKTSPSDLQYRSSCIDANDLNASLIFRKLTPRRDMGDILNLLLLLD